MIDASMSERDWKRLAVIDAAHCSTDDVEFLITALNDIRRELAACGAGARNENFDDAPIGVEILLRHVVDSFTTTGSVDANGMVLCQCGQAQYPTDSFAWWAPLAPLPKAAGRGEGE